MCVVTQGYQLPVSDCQMLLCAYLSQCMHIHICKQMHKHTRLTRMHRPTVTQSLTFYVLLSFTYTQKAQLPNFFLFFPLRNLTPTHSMYTEGNRTALYAFTHSDSFSDYGMSQIPVFQTVACKCVTDHISQSNYAARDT